MVQTQARNENGNNTEEDSKLKEGKDDTGINNILCYCFLFYFFIILY